MKILVTGATGQLGHDVLKHALALNHNALGTSRNHWNSNCIHLDITDPIEVNKVVIEFNPDVIVHCAAWTNVDSAEAEECRETVEEVNRLGTRYLAEAAREVDAKMIYISTDYVFDGQGDTPYDPDLSKPNPINYYGQTKLQGEEEVKSILNKYYIIRISWVFGLYGNNFVKTMLRLSMTQPQVRVVCDQVGSPTYTQDLAILICELINTEKYGTYHATNKCGYVSWYEFCTEIYRQIEAKTEVIPIRTQDFQCSAKRPHNSRLDISKLETSGITGLRDWKEALKSFIEEELKWVK